MIKNNIESVQMAAGYAGGQVKINVHTKDHQQFILETDEAKLILQIALNAGYDTSLQPRQQYHRIHLTHGNETCPYYNEAVLPDKQDNCSLCGNSFK